MSKRFIAGAIAAAVAGATFLLAGPASAESCVTLPATTGATIEVAGQPVRVPSTSGVAVCVEPGGLPGYPRVDSGGGVISVVVGGGSTTAGYVAVRYTLDGVPTEHRVPIPGTGNSGEICVASIGEPARADCLVKVSVDDIPDIPPVPTLPPPPTIPPIPTPEPLPTVSPEPLPTVSPEPLPTPEPDPYCVNSRICVPYGGQVLYMVDDIIGQWVWWAQNFDNDDDVCIDEAPPIGIQFTPTTSSASERVICDEVLPS